VAVTMTGHGTLATGGNRGDRARSRAPDEPLAVVLPRRSRASDRSASVIFEGAHSCGSRRPSPRSAGSSKPRAGSGRRGTRFSCACSGPSRTRTKRTA
jgi:hypothetical protein